MAYSFRKTFKFQPPPVDAWFDDFGATSNAGNACDTTLRNRYNRNSAIAIRQWKTVQSLGSATFARRTGGVSPLVAVPQRVALTTTAGHSTPRALATCRIST